ncbi:MAG TPA: hypothetical protein VMM18_03765 [Gemmatimonadaceae bacterium]|nr:hypothetical protein [Gemmatimonadaceae bacterium]
MNSRQQGLRHLAYFERLARLEETDTEWRATTAGLVVLRLLDAWMEEGPEQVHAGSWSFEAAREEVDTVSVGNPVRTILAGVLEGMADTRTRTITTIAPRLMAYGRSLNLTGRWQLAADVYQTILAHAHPNEDVDLLIDANMRLGYCLRMQGQFGPAMAAYADAGQLASEIGDVAKVIRVRIADAKIAIDRGNLPEAEAILDRTIAETRDENKLSEVHATALHDRAAVAHLRGDYERAIHLAYDALDLTEDPGARDRVLADIAASFFELGMRSAARDAQLILAATAQAQYIRWMATLNLLEIAAFDECEPIFEQYRRELGAAPLPPMLETVYHLYVGNGCRLFGHLDAARESLRHAVELATKHEFNQLSFTAQKNLDELEQGVAAERRAASPPKESVLPVAAAIHSMRRLAGIDG